MRTINKFYILMFSLCILFSAACKDKGSSAAAYVPPDSTDPSTPAPNVSPTSPLALTLSTKYTGVALITPLTFTETGTTICAASAAQPAVTCTVVVPEGRLFFSELLFSYAWLPSNCRLLNFQPYYYQANNTTSYSKPGTDTPLDCTLNPIPSDCFAGAAVQLVPDFPKKRSLIHLPDETTLTTPTSAALKLASAWTVNWNSNRHTANDLPLAKRGTNFNSAQLGGLGDGYVQNTYTDYVFSCRDAWYDPVTYRINLNVRDEDTSAAGPNNFLTWKEAP